MITRSIVCTAIVASSLAFAACSGPKTMKPSASTSIPSTTSLTTESLAPSSTPGVSVSAPASGDQTSAEGAIRKGYVEKVAHCYATRDAVADIVAITWSPPGFKANEGGSGKIDDTNPALGGEFTATYKDGRWNTVYHWC